METQSGQIVQKRLHVAALSVPQLGQGEEPGAEMCRGQKVGVSPALSLPQLDSDTQPLPWSRGLGCILGVGPEGLASTKGLTREAHPPPAALPGA